MNLLQRRSYATKKVRSVLCILKPVLTTYFQAIISTCRQWRGVGSEFLFRCLYFSDPAKMISLSTFLEATSDPGITSPSWWTRRIHVSRYHPSPSRRTTIENMDHALVSIVSHCPNLEIFVMERPMGSAFGPVVDALATHAFRKLHTVQWNVPGEALAKVIWALDSLPLLVAVHVDLETPVPSIQETANLGSATNLPIMLPFLKQLSLRGYVEEIVEQCAGWDLPALCNLSVDSGTSVQDIPDIVEFLRNHGPNLTLLDLNVSPLLDVRKILMSKSHHLHLQRRLARDATQRRCERTDDPSTRKHHHHRSSWALACLWGGLRCCHRNAGSRAITSNVPLERPQCGGAEQDKFPEAAARQSAQPEHVERSK